MRQNDFENWIRDRVDDLDFQATDEGWKRMAQSLKEKNRQKTIIPVISRPLRIAATVAGITGLAVLLTMLQQRNDGENIPVSGTVSNITSDAVTLPDTGSRELTPANELYIPRRHRTGIAQYQSHDETAYNDSTGSPALPDSVPKVQPASGLEQVAGNVTEKEPVKHNQYTPQQVLPDETYRASRHLQNTQYLVDAHIGSQPIGGIQYQVAFTSRIPINSRMFLDGSLTMSSNAISYREDYTINGISVTPGFSGSGDQVVNITETRTRTRYANAIYALGLAPMIGTHLNKRLDIAAGAYVTRNLNTSLPLQQEAAASNADLINTGIIEERYKVNEWDYGLKTTLDYKLYEQVAVQVGYRMGLSDYLEVNNKRFSNSGIVIGLKYYIK